jgi:trans-2,3-dihydro-3-hydroxyanthranilate isomerase
MRLTYDGAMASRIAFTLVDVFSSGPFRGNQLAVFHDAGRLKAAQMQTLAHEMNFSESTFVIPAPRRADPLRVRIFTPRREIPMAGHPTIGTAWVLASRGALQIGDATLRLGVGDTMVTIEGKARKPAFIWMSHKPVEFGERREDPDRIATGLGIDTVDVRDDLPIEAVSSGNPFLFVPLTSVDALKRCVSNSSALCKLFGGGSRMLPVYLFVCEGSPTTSVRARMFAPHTDGITEDPATGSAAAPLGAYLRAHGLIGSAARARFQVIQGVEMGRRSEITVEVLNTTGDRPSIRIGGRCALVGEGQMRL